MAFRMTRNDAERIFEKLCKKLNQRQAKDNSDVGGLMLDYIECYGGYRIVEITNKSGGEKAILFSGRKSPKELVEAASILIEAIDSGLVAVPGVTF